MRPVEEEAVEVVLFPLAPDDDEDEEEPLLLLLLLDVDNVVNESHVLLPLWYTWAMAPPSSSSLPLLPPPMS